MGSPLHQFIDKFASAWELSGGTRQSGRLVALLMTTDKPYLSSSEIADALQLSAGSVSSATRSLIEQGLIARRHVQGDRRHYFSAEDDMWGSFLTAEHNYLDRSKQVLESALTELPDLTDTPRERLRTAAIYMEWITGYHQKMHDDWQAFRKERMNGGSDD